MRYSLSFLPEVEKDVLAAYLWYEEKSFGLGEEFLRIFYARTNALSYNALLYQKVYGEFRRCLLGRFPYAVYFRTEENRVVVFGLFHCARDPRTVRAQLTIREQ
jgi:hypothetical protein